MSWAEKPLQEDITRFVRSVGTDTAAWNLLDTQSKSEQKAREKFLSCTGMIKADDDGGGMSGW